MSGSSWRVTVRDTFLIVFGCFLFAVGADCFEIPNGLAAGGVTGLATVVHAVTGLPVGLMSIAMNVVLILLVVRQGDRHYLVRTAGGIVALGVLIDAVAPFVPVLGDGDLLLCALWGGVITGVGLGLVFRTGGNTGGTDIIAQLVSSRTSLPVGTACIIVDTMIIALSALTFSVEQALYAAVATYIAGRVIDAVVDGPRSERAAYVISNKHAEIANEILYTLNRGCTELQARGGWTGNNRPVLFCVLGRSEMGRLKEIVSGIDPDAIVILSEVHEVFGEGFRQINGR